ncbi:MAG: cobalamin biosynthesis protein [Geminicoccaceae bacterium]|nr:cobalamin biosynthesis protein [Geminicoccaceae bacterium]
MILTLALLLDAWLGDPPWLWRRLPHPVVLIGRLIEAFERRFNRRRRREGVLLTLLLVAGGVVLGRAIEAMPAGEIWSILIAAVLLAHKSLIQHVDAVAAALEESLDEGRRAVARIVGRDPASLDEAGVARAAIESAAENFADGVVAPAVWLAVAGLPGILVCKAINTADSMIGHRNERYAAFGWAAARLDDLLNLVPARLAGLLLAGGTGAMRIMWRDAARHRSPNAGWPEAAMAARLDLALAGPRRYGGVMVEDAWLNPEGRRAPRAKDARAACRVVRQGWWLLLAISLVLWIARW